MKAEIISVGTELLLGEIVNTNAPFLARQLSQLGIDSYFQVTVGDNQSRLAAVMRQALERADLLIISGGLGPTMDDVTKEAIAQVSRRPLAPVPSVMASLEERARSRGRKLKANSRSQAYLPQGARAIPNDHGSAPGLWLETEDAIIVALPGPPRELEPMVRNRLVPRLQDAFSLEPLFSRRLHCTGMGESTVEARLEDLIRSQSEVTIATYARPGDVAVRLAVKAVNKAQAEALLAPVEEAVRERLGRHIYGSDGQTLAGAVGALLLRRGETLSVAESCTGGWLASRITAEPGSSRYFMGATVAYANAVKEAHLDVAASILEQHGAVSRETALAMARGAVLRFGSDWSLAVTGIAGPGGGSSEKPVGTVFIAWAGRQQGELRSEAVQRHFHGGRRETVQASSQHALDLLRQRLL